MATPSPRTALQAPVRDWLRGTVVRGVVPGWVLSLVFHSLMLVTLFSVTQLPSCRGDYSGEDGTGFREIGLRAREDANSAPSAGPGEPGLAEVASSQPQQAPTTPDVAPPTISESPPVPLSLPQVGTGPPVLGTGPPPLSGIGGTPAHSTNKSTTTGSGTPGSRGGGGGQGKGVGQTSLFGVNDAGKTFVYVIDRSASMQDHGAFRAAKAELMTSLSRLTEVQQFQVILYNDQPLSWTPRNGRFRMFFGTDAQRLEISELVGAISPDGGTEHLPALELALKFEPDVIFLLTDGASKALNSAELKQIARVNRRGTHIHCIEFGTSPPPSGEGALAAPNFLMKLASQNQGKYTYRNVKTFDP
ncbi:MAG: hypothetical protein DWH81_07090 [Planctomycetota bacterium]|nr:MAG: hypothetical protein DWH81_07090 [Planctomycetota bacterium]